MCFDILLVQNMANKLPREFYLNEDILKISRQLLGKFLYTYIEEELTGGMIVEVEAYRGPEDRGSHSYGMRRTKRNECMYLEGGHAYIYFTYGLHTLFNIVTNKEGIPHAILVRAIEPKEGIETMLKRRNKLALARNIAGGPAVLTQALGITLKYNGESLTGSKIWLEDKGIVFSEMDIKMSPRVGIDYAGEDRLLPWRFRVHNNPWTSPAK